MNMHKRYKKRCLLYINNTVRWIVHSAQITIETIKLGDFDHQIHIDIYIHRHVEVVCIYTDTYRE